MSSKYKFYDPDKLYFVSFSVVFWIDLFARNEYNDIMLDSWYYQVHKGLGYSQKNHKSQREA